MRKFAIPAPEAPEERCHFCGTLLSPDHRHLVDLSTMRFACSCEVCLILQSEKGTYQTLPQRYLQLEDFQMSDTLWSDFLIPVNMTFFVKSRVKHGTVAFYPAPTGATESKLKMEAWDSLVLQNPILDTLLPDLEALLVNRLQNEGLYFIVPVDSCYRLIGMIRLAWQGLFGGKEVSDIINRFFEELKSKSTACPM